MISTNCSIQLLSVTTLRSISQGDEESSGHCMDAEFCITRKDEVSVLATGLNINKYAFTGDLHGEGRQIICFDGHYELHLTLQ